MSIVTHRAKWVLVNPERIIEDGYVTVSGGRIVACGRGKGSRGTRVKDHGSGVLMPALVNAHTHLDLTPLAGTIPTEGGFISWVEAVIHGKAALTDEEIKEGILTGQRLLLESGCILAADHRSFPLQDNVPEKPFVKVFREYLGSLEPQLGIADGDTHSSLSAHAPHTTAPAVIQRLKNLCRERNLVFSLHVAESSEEKEFVTSAGGKWADLLRNQGISFKDWGLPAPSPVRHLERLGVLDERTLAVHLVQAERNDLEILKQKGVRVCLCPRSNRNLLAELPDVRTMLDMGMRPALGTDSLASVSSLDLFAEMALLAREVPGVPPRAIIAMGTVNGARALHMEKEWGTLDPGRHAAILFIPVHASSVDSLLDMLVSGDMQETVEWTA